MQIPGISTFPSFAFVYLFSTAVQKRDEVRVAEQTEINDLSFYGNMYIRLVQNHVGFFTSKVEQYSAVSRATGTGDILIGYTDPTMQV